MHLNNIRVAALSLLIIFSCTCLCLAWFSSSSGEPQFGKPGDNIAVVGSSMTISVSTVNITDVEVLKGTNTKVTVRSIVADGSGLTDLPQVDSATYADNSNLLNGEDSDWYLSTNTANSTYLPFIGGQMAGDVDYDGNDIYGVSKATITDLYVTRIHYDKDDSVQVSSPSVGGAGGIEAETFGVSVSYAGDIAVMESITRFQLPYAVNIDSISVSISDGETPEGGKYTRFTLYYSETLGAGWTNQFNSTDVFKLVSNSSGIIITSGFSDDTHPAGTRYRWGCDEVDQTNAGGFGGDIHLNIYGYKKTGD